MEVKRRNERRSSTHERIRRRCRSECVVVSFQGRSYNTGDHSLVLGPHTIHEPSDNLLEPFVHLLETLHLVRKTLLVLQLRLPWLLLGLDEPRRLVATAAGSPGAGGRGGKV